MITIIHGENIKESRNYFWNLKQKSQNPIFYTSENINALDLLQNLASTGLFEDSKDVFIENLFSLKKLSEKEKIIKIVLENEKNNQIVIWENKILTPSILKSFKTAEIKKFDIPQKIFAFLDTIGIDKKKSIQLFHEILENEEPEYIFFMIIRHFRIMLSLTPSHTTTIDEVKRLAPWQKSKYEKQLKSIGFERLKNFYSDLFLTDFKQKTGQNPLSLMQAIDILLLKI